MEKDLTVFPYILENLACCVKNIDVTIELFGTFSNFLLLTPQCSPLIQFIIMPTVDFIP